MTTDLLIERLARELQPVRTLPRPGLRAARWLAGAAIYLGLIAAPLTSGADIAANSTGGVWFFLPQLFAVITGASAAAAAFMSVIPGYSRRAWIGAAIATAMWAGSLAIGAGGALSHPAAALSVTSEWVCVAMVLLTGLPLMIVLRHLLRRGAPLNPSLTGALSALSVGALANIGACISHPHIDNAATLVWHGATIATLVIVSAFVTPFVLRWTHEP